MSGATAGLDDALAEPGLGAGALLDLITAIRNGGARPVPGGRLPCRERNGAFRIREVSDSFPVVAS